MTGLMSRAVSHITQAFASSIDQQAYRWQGMEHLEPRLMLSSNLDVITATYLTGLGDSQAAEVDINHEGRIIYAGDVTDMVIAAGEQAVAFSGGMIAIFEQTGELTKIAPLGSHISDMEVSHQSGAIAVAGNFGVAVLNADASEVIWSNDLGGNSASRISIANDGSVAALAGKRVYSFGSDGTAVANWNVSIKGVHDVAISSETQSIFVTGYDQVHRILKNSFLYSFNYSGKENWRNFGWTYGESRAAGNMSDNEGYRVTIGRDGYLYYLGECDGGNNLYRYQPQDLKTKVTNPNIDLYNQMYGLSGSARMAYVARMDPATGYNYRGNYLMARLSSGKNNSLFGRGSIDADENGNVIIGGKSAASIKNRDSLKIAGKATGAYAGADPYVAVFNSDFTARPLFTTFVGEGGKGETTAVAISEEVVATGIDFNAGSMVTFKAVQGTLAREVSKDAGGGYLAFWKPNSSNQAPQLDNEIPDQSALVNKPFAFAFSEKTFSDPDKNDTLTYTAAMVSGETTVDLPDWLSFDGDTRMFTGTPTETGSVTIQVTATDPKGLTATDTFTITVLENIGDLSGNNNGTDILKRAGTGHVVVSIMNNDTQIDEKQIGRCTNLNWEIIGRTDWNGDGSEDVLWWNRSNGVISCWQLNDGQFKAHQFVAQVTNTTWRPGAVAGSQSNGSILWHNQSTGEMSRWDFSGSSVTHNDAGSTGSGSGYVLQGYADINRDGNRDILWRQQSTGEVYGWMLDSQGKTTMTRKMGSVPTNWQYGFAGMYENNTKTGLAWYRSSANVGKVWLLGTGGTVDQEKTLNFS